MKLRVDKEEIQKGLQNIQGIVERKTTMPILSHFLLKVNKTTSITATDLDIAFSRPLRSEIMKKGSLCIPARKLLEIAKEVEEDLTLESQENNWLQITSGKSTFKLMCLSEEEYPTLPEVSHTEEVVLDISSVQTMIEKTVHAIGDSDTRYTLNGLLMHFLPGKKKIELRVIGTDGHRLSYVSRGFEGKLPDEKKIILPKKAALELKRLFEENEGEVRIGLDKNHVFFTIGETIFTSRLIEGNYPNYEQVIPQDNEKKAVFERDPFSKALRRAAIMSRERTNAVRFDLEQGKLTLISQNPDVGEAREEIATQYKGEPISIGFNVRYLLDAIQVMEGEAIELDIHDSLSPTLLREEGGEDFKCVVMPMRI